MNVYIRGLWALANSTDTWVEWDIQGYHQRINDSVIRLNVHLKNIYNYNSSSDLPLLLVGHIKTELHIILRVPHV